MRKPRHSEQGSSKRADRRSPVDSNKRIGKVSVDSGDWIENLKKKCDAGLHDLGGKLDSGLHMAGQMVKEGSEKIKEHPLAILPLAFRVGLLAGKLLKGKK
jgi:ElaB/YqjD/DUF883 family membrane-anchored ribosome-binding protein